MDILRYRVNKSGLNGYIQVKGEPEFNGYIKVQGQQVRMELEVEDDEQENKTIRRHKC